MASQDRASLELLDEARSVDTSAARLLDLVQFDPSLGPIIASNPSASWKLLDQLALKHPAEVLGNPLLLLLDLEAVGTYRELSLPALVVLCLACESKQYASLFEETWLRIRSGLDELRKQEEASLSCDWVYQRTFTLQPDDCDSLIDKPLDFTLEVRACMESRGHISVDGIPDLSDRGPDLSNPLREELFKILQSISSGDIGDYINDEDLVRDDGCGSDYRLKAVGLLDNLSIEGTSLYRGEDCILEFEYNLDGDCSPILYADGIITVPVEFTDEENREYEISMGELGALTALAQRKRTDCLPSDWPSRLAALLIP